MGGQGSGKTTLAHRLGALLSAPVFELDLVGWKPETGRERRLEDKLSRVTDIAAQPAWITEGTMLGWTDPLLRAADRIIWLDVPWHVAVWRVLLRHIHADLSGNNRHPGWRRLLRFLWYTRNYYWNRHTSPPPPPDGEGNATRDRTVQRLSAYLEKTIRCRSSADAEALFRTLSSR